MAAVLTVVLTVRVADDDAVWNPERESNTNTPPPISKSTSSAATMIRPRRLLRRGIVSGGGVKGKLW